MSDAPKIHVKNPTVNDHSLFFPGADVGIPLSLMGIYSYFPSRTPTRTELEECRVLLMTPEGSSWNPHSDVYTRNEESMLDWNGQMIEPKDRVRILLSDIKHMGKSKSHDGPVNTSQKSFPYLLQHISRHETSSGS